VQTPDFRALEHVFVFQPQRRGRQRRQAAVQCMAQQGVRRAAATRQPRSQNIGVQNDSHDIAEGTPGNIEGQGRHIKTEPAHGLPRRLALRHDT
jgi:hypothetical protein